MAEIDGTLNFSVEGVRGKEQEWSFDSLSDFKTVVKKYRNSLPEDYVRVIWCEFDGVSMEFDTFEDILNEFG